MTNYMKITFSDKYLEITKHPFPHLRISASSGGRKLSSTPPQSMENYEANLKVSINRARKKIQRLLECNFTNQYAFVTLTFKPSTAIDITDIKGCHKMFTDFKKRLAYYLEKHLLPKFKYLGVIEFQDTNGQGAIHYHLVCNLIQLPPNVLQELWTYGWANQVRIKGNITENEKISYYLKKGITDPRLNGHKRYFQSHGLKQPITFQITDPKEFYKNLDRCQATLLKGETFDALSGQITYEKYYLKSTEELMNYVQEL